MAEKKAYKEFRRLLQRAIGNRTQKQFAEDAKMSAPYLSRLINDHVISQPSIGTVLKISAASEGRVSEDQLKAACGYLAEEFDQSPDLDDERLTCNARQQLIADSFIRGMAGSAGSANVWKDIESFVDTARMIYEPRIVNSFGATIEFDGDHQNPGRMGAERVCAITLAWSTDDADVQLGAILFYSRTSKGGVVVQDVAFDLTTLFEFQHPLAGRLVLERSSKGDMNLSEYPRVMFFHWKTEKAKEEYACLRLIQAIFRDDKDNPCSDEEALHMIAEIREKKKTQNNNKQTNA